MVKNQDAIITGSEFVEQMDAEKENPLEKQFKSLEQKWDSIKQSSSRTVSVDDHLPDQLLTYSPETLISPLDESQNLPSDGCPFDSRHTDRAVVIEVIKEREAALENVELKGRRLFEETDTGSDLSEETCSECLDLVQESEARTVSSYQGSDDGENFTICGDSDSDQCFVGHACGYHCSCSLESYMEVGLMEVVEEKGKTGTKVAEKIGMFDYGGRWMIRMAWLGLLVMLFAIGIVAIRCIDSGDEDFLVPT